MFRRLCFSLLLVAPLLCSVLFAAETGKPNIILMMADDLGWGDTGFNGNTIIKTPCLDEMAKAGVRFTRFYSGAPVCSPTRGSCLTGRHPFRYGIWNANAGHLRKEEICLAEVLGKEGYTCGHFGKWHLGTLDPNTSGKGAVRNPRRNYMTPGMKGFDTWFSTEYAVPTWDPFTRKESPYFEKGVLATENLEGCDSRVLMDRAIPFIRNAAAKKQPFFAVIWFHAPHEPVVAGPEFKAMYSQYVAGKQNYYGVVTALDAQVGRLRQELRNLGVAENTMLWFASDNGPEGEDGNSGSNRGSAGPFRGRKRSLWQGGIRVPALLEWQGKVTPATSTDVPCSSLDYFPTILATLGISLDEMNRPFDGVNLLPLFDGKMKERPRPIMFETTGRFGSDATRGSHHISMIDNRYVFLSDLDGAANELLFDLLEDPGETTDVSGRHPEIVATMRKQLEEFRLSCVRSLAGEDYRSPFTPDKDDIHVDFRKAN